MSGVRKIDKVFFYLFKNINGIGKDRGAGTEYLYDPYMQYLSLDPFLGMVSHIPFSSIPLFIHPLHPHRLYMYQFIPSY